jgi:gliding motility-associated-like protein
LNASNFGATYAWQDNSTDSVFTAAQAGKYWVRVKLGGCEKSDTIEVNIDLGPQVFLGDDTTLCPGDTLILEATPNTINYLWQDNSIDSIFKVFQNGLYWLEAEFNECRNRDSILVNYRNPLEANLGNDTSICANENFVLVPELSDTGTILWQDSTVTNNYVVSSAGRYSITVSNKCSTVSDEILIDVIDCECKITIPNVFTPNNDFTNDILLIKSKCEFLSYSLKVFNRWGVKVFETNDSKIGFTGKRNGMDLSEGVYFYQLNYSNQLEKSINLQGSFTLLR